MSPTIQSSAISAVLARHRAGLRIGKLLLALLLMFSPILGIGPARSTAAPVAAVAPNGHAMAEALPPDPAPDLEIVAGDIVLDDPAPAVGAAIDVSITVRNVGTAGAAPASLVITDTVASDNSLAGTRSFADAVQAIAPQGQATFTYTATIAGPAGMHMLCVRVEPQPQEQKLLNNQACRAVSVDQGNAPTAQMARASNPGVSQALSDSAVGRVGIHQVEEATRATLGGADAVGIQRAAPQDHSRLRSLDVQASTASTTGTTTDPLQRFQTYTLNGGYVAAGTGMRNRGYGTITLAGIPEGASVRAAYLYWDILGDTPEPAFAQGSFNSQAIAGTLIGQGDGPCWDNYLSFAYRADVTSLVGGNGTYALSGFATGTSDGRDPWPNDNPPPMSEGASLVVVYESPTDPYTQILLYDGSFSSRGYRDANGTLTEALPGTLTLDGFSAPASGGAARTTFIVADGQDFKEYGSTFNGTALLGVVWDGSDPISGTPPSQGSLWDTTSVDVTEFVAPGSTMATLTLQGGHDCLVWLAQVFAVDDAVPVPQPAPDLAVSADDLVFSDPAPDVGDPLTISTTIRNTGDITVTVASLLVTDTIGLSSAALVSQTITVPIAPHGQVVVPVYSGPAPSPAGAHTICVRVSTIETSPAGRAEANLGDNTACERLNTISPAVPLSQLVVRVPDLRTWLGASASLVAEVRNTGTVSITIAAASTSATPWATIAPLSLLPTRPIAPGEAAQITFAVAIPSEIEPASFPLNQALSLIVTTSTGTQASDAFSIEILEEAPTTLTITTIDIHGGLIPGVLLMIGRDQQLYQTGGDGTVEIPAQPGTWGVYAYRPGYRARGVGVVVTGGQANTLTIQLRPGQTFEVSQVVSRPLTPAEVAARGVQLSDPQNYWVYDFTIFLDLTPQGWTVPNVILPRNPQRGDSIAIPTTTIGRPGRGGDESSAVVWGRISYLSPTQRVESWIIIPGRFRILKQFWEATIYLKNEAEADDPSAILLTDIEASLEIDPDQGMTLPPLNGQAQPFQQTTLPIPAGEGRSISWVLRGDATGIYLLSAEVSASLEFNGMTLPDELEIFAPPAAVIVYEPTLAVNYTVPSYVTAGEVFTLRMDVTNTTPVTIHGVTVELDFDRLVNVRLPSGLRAVKEVGSGSLAPGERATVTFQLISEVTGCVSLPESFVAGDPHIAPFLNFTPSQCGGFLGYVTCQVGGMDVPVGGNFLMSEIDFGGGGALPGEADLFIVRTYNSADHGIGLFGLGWRSNLDMRLTPEQDGSIVVTMADGRRTRYMPLGDGTYRSLDGTNAEVAESAGTYTLTTPGHSSYSFDATGRLIGVRSGSKVLTFQYDAGTGMIMSISDQAGRTVTITTSNGRIVQVAEGATVYEYGYDPGFTRLERMIDPRGNAISYGYENNLLTERYDQNDNLMLRNSYDGNLRLKEQTRASGPSDSSTLRFDYDTQPGQVRLTDGMGNTTNIDIDPRHQAPTGSVDALGHQRSYQLDEQGDPVAVTGPKGVTTYATYNEMGLPTSVAATVTVDDVVQTLTTSIAYNEHNDPLTITDPRGHTTSYEYAFPGKPSRVTGPLGNATTYTYDAEQRVTSMTLTGGLVVEYSYNAEGRLESVTKTYQTLVPGTPQQENPALEEQRTRVDYQYTPQGWISYRSDPYTLPGSATAGVTYTYDAAGNLTGITNQLGQVATAQYDAVGNVVERTNFLGQRTQYDYDWLRRLTTVTEFAAGGNRRTSYRYDDNGNLVARTDPLGVITTYTYDGLNRLVSASVPLLDGSVDRTDNTYDASGNLIATIRSNDHGSADRVTLFTYDELNRLIERTEAAGIYNYQTRLTYDQTGNVIRARSTKLPGSQVNNWDNPAQVTTATAAYDALNRVTSTTADAWDPLSGINKQLTTTYQYSAAQNLRTVTDPSGLTVTTQEDPVGRSIITTVTPSTSGGVQPGAEPQTSYAFYDPRNLLIRTLDPRGGQRDSAYDLLGRVVSVTGWTAPYGGGMPLTSHFYYTNTARPTVTSIGPAPHFARQDVTTDEFGQVSHATIYTGAPVAYPQLPDGPLTTHYEYDAQGNRTAVTDPDGNTTHFSYETTGWLREVSATVTVLGQGVQTLTTHYEYDSVGNPVRVTNANGHSSDATFDVLGRLVSAADPLGNTYTQGYDGLGRITEHQDAKGQLTSYTYDNASRLLERAGAGGLTTNWSYNDAGLPLTMVDHAGSSPPATTSYAYDGLLRLAEIANPQGLVRYSYDSANRPVGLSFGADAGSLKLALYDYDSLDRLTGATNWLGQHVTYNYSGARLGSIGYPNGATAKFGYDGAGRLTALTHASNGGALFGASYTLDNLGRVSAAREKQDGTTRTISYTYDELSRLTGEVMRLGSTQAITNTYRYDLVGNRLEQASAYHSMPQATPAISTTVYSYDNAERLIERETTTTAGLTISTSSTYDANSNLVEEIASGPGATEQTQTAFTYDSRDRLIQWQQQQSGPAAITRLASFGYNGNDQRIWLDGDAGRISYLNAGPQVLIESGGSQPATSYFYTPGASAPLFRDKSGGQGAWYHYDASGSVRALSDATGAAQNSYAFDGFGVTTAQSEPLTNNRQFSGLQRDPTDLYYTGCGYYDPAVGRSIGGCGGVLAAATPVGGGEGMDAEQADGFGQAMSNYRQVAFGPLGSSLPSGPALNRGCEVFCRYEVTLVKPPDPPPSPDTTSSEAFQLGRKFIGFLTDGADLIDDASNLLGLGDDHWVRQANQDFRSAIDELDQFFKSPAGLMVLGIANKIIKALPALISLALDFMPVVGTIKGIAEAIIGYDLITGEKLADWERVLNILPFDGAGDALSRIGRAADPLARGADDAANLLGGAGRNGDEFADLASEVHHFDDAAEAGTEIGHLDDAAEAGAEMRRSADVGDIDAGDVTTKCLYRKDSFSADTPVATADGAEPIGDIDAGDHVLAYNESTGTAGSYTITAVMAHTDPVILEMTIGGEQLETTPEHPFYVLLRGWVEAGELRAGDSVRNAGGRYGAVQAVEVERRPQVMYNLTVAEAHTFFVGDGKWLVHNNDNNGNCLWTPHGYKHFPAKNESWGDIEKSTKRGPAKYKPEVDIEALERDVWANGQPVTNGKSWKVQEFDEEIGASEGKPSRWVRVEYSGNTIHGHPITQAEYKKLLK